METEVKLAFDSKEALFGIINAEWFSDYCLDTALKKPVKLVNIYYDTPEGTIAKKGGAVRVRSFFDEEGEKFEHTVKFGGGASEGLHQRYEWNVIADSERFDIKEFIRLAIANDDPRDLLEEFLEGVDQDSLRPICSTVFNRTTYMFGFGDSMMEACFDDGIIKAGDKEDIICELELELESGDVVDLKDMAEFIVENTGAKPFNESKFTRCLALLGND